jgi:tRNA-specific 2-thiouridylase
VDTSGRVLGHHGGQHLFTVGQRRGLGISASEPLYVVRKESDGGRVVVGPRAALARTRVDVGGATLYRPGSEVDSVRLRYRSAPVPSRVEGSPAAGRHARLTLSLDRPVDGAAPGQVACLMRGDSVVGVATIRPTEPDRTPAIPQKEETVAV